MLKKVLAPWIDGHLDAISLWDPHQTLYKNSPYGGPHWYCYSTWPTIFSRLVNWIYPILMLLTTAYCPNAWLYHMVFVTVDWIISTQAEVCHHWIYQVRLSYASFWCWCILFKIRPLKNWTDYFFWQENWDKHKLINKIIKNKYIYIINNLRHKTASEASTIISA